MYDAQNVKATEYSDDYLQGLLSFALVKSKNFHYMILLAIAVVDSKSKQMQRFDLESKTWTAMQVSSN